MTSPFISVTDLGAYLRQDLDDDDLAVIATDSACDVVRGWVDQELDESLNDTVVLDGNGADVLLLPELPVTAVDSVTLYDGESSEELLVAGSDEDYLLGSGGLLYRMGNTWPEARQCITVVYDHGYATGEVPSDIRLVALQVAARIHDAAHLVRETVGSYSIEYVQGMGGLTKYEKDVLRKYRRVA